MVVEAGSTSFMNRAHVTEMLVAAKKACAGLVVEDCTTPESASICVTTVDGKRGLRVEIESDVAPEQRAYLVTFIDRAQTMAPLRYQPYHADAPEPLVTLFRTMSGPLKGRLGK